MFRIEWVRSAVDDLATAWATADSELRQAITDAASRIDDILAADPSWAGESRIGGVRVLIVLPLTVKFRVNVRLNEVLVTVARVGRPPNH